MPNTRFRTRLTWGYFRCTCTDCSGKTILRPKNLSDISKSCIKVVCRGESRSFQKEKGGRGGAPNLSAPSGGTSFTLKISTFWPI